MGNPAVSIIICHYSLVDDFGGGRALLEDKTRSEMLRETMFSLIENTDYPADIIVIDNGGKPDDSDFLLELTRLGKINTYVRNKNNMYFGFAWNQGAKLATSDYLCFTCNDIHFGKSWLQETIMPVMKKNVYKEVGEFTTHRIAGSHWHRKMHTMGYTIVAPQENKVEHLARNGGVDFYKDIRVTKELIDGSVIDFSLP